ncbi:MAG TPA: ornithine carbamoyltransferase [Anaerolineae bacterium]|nr:ornithine carbamoyltransferase [Anaerolineae bacterium]
MKKDLVNLADLSADELWHILNVAQELKEEWQGGGNQPILVGKTLAMVFQKPSLRTRVSFETGMLQLGGQALYLSPSEIQLGKRESVEDVARVLSRYVDCIMARVFAHREIVTLAQYASVPVINGLSDHNHPCQALADLLTILEKKGALRGLRLAWVGDGNNVLTSLLFGASKMGMDVAVATPRGYEPPTEVMQLAFRFAGENESAIEVGNDPHAAVRDADVIYTDVWTSMGQDAERQERLRVFPPYQVNAALVSGAAPDVIVMHCLPAHRGQEISGEVADGPHSVLFDQAENRMHAQKGLLAVLLANK